MNHAHDDSVTGSRADWCQAPRSATSSALITLGAWHRCLDAEPPGVGRHRVVSSGHSKSLIGRSQMRPPAKTPALLQSTSTLSCVAYAWSASAATASYCDTSVTTVLMCSGSSAAAHVGIEFGVKGPTFLLQATRDPDGANLDRIQVIKMWQAGDGYKEQIFNVALSGGRKASASTSASCAVQP